MKQGGISPILISSLDIRQHYQDYQDELARFVQQNQLLDMHLWERFVAQFTEQIDGSNMGWRGEYFGKMMRGGCLTWQYTRSASLYQTWQRAVIAIMKTQEKNGRISSFSEDTQFDAWDLWCRKYVMLGMIYFYEICGSKRLKERIVRSLCRQADHIMRYVGPEEGKREITACTRHWGGLNSCSILEPFARLYGITGISQYASFCRYIIETGFCADGNLIELVKLGIEPYRYPQVKAYEMMSCFEGLIEFGVITGHAEYITIAEQFARLIQRSDVTAIGCCGCTHELFDHSTDRQSSYHEGIMQETCVTVTWMKLCYRLLQLTGDAFFADEIERSALNAMSGAVNDFGNEKNQGLIFDSYSPLVCSRRGEAIGGRQSIGNGEIYGCCACIGSAGTAISNLYGFLLTKDGIAINHYRKGKVDFPTPSGAAGQIRILSHLPSTGRIRIRLRMEKKEKLKIHLRIPSWSHRSRYSVNDEAAVSARSGEYVIIEREWEDGDIVHLVLDVKARLIQARDGAYAITKGGYLLAGDERLGEDFNRPLVLSGATRKTVHLRSVTPTVRAQMEYQMIDADGNIRSFVDYASAGKNWDEKNCRVTVWFHRKREE